MEGPFEGAKVGDGVGTDVGDEEGLLEGRFVGADCGWRETEGEDVGDSVHGLNNPKFPPALVARQLA